MSLVHEALQKAAQEKQRHTPFPPATPSSAPSPTATLTGRSRAPVWVALLVAITAVAVVAAIWLLNQHPETVVRHEREVAPVAPVKVETPVSEPATPVLKLTGIVVMPDGVHTAVINGKTVYESHFVDGAVVKKIERDRVTLEVNGRDVVLRLF
jgi:type II secretory pathway component PulC